MRRAITGTVVLCLVWLFAAATSGTSSAETGEGNAPMACYEGRIPGSSNWDGYISTHVHGSACTIRWAQLVWDDNNNCCVPTWVKIERQEFGSYGWVPSHIRYKQVLFGNFGAHNTPTVPWIQYTDQRFQACWGKGTSQPTSWDCGPWVN